MTRQTAARRPRPEHDPSLPGILVVDDVEANRHLLESYLLHLQVRVIQAADGRAALDAAEAEPPDLVLLDAQMPKLDGFEVCRRLKETPATRLTPVVMVTSLSAVGDRVRALQAGADDFLSKPIDRVELVARVQSLLRLKATYDRLEDAQQVILSLGLTVEAKGPYTEAHATRAAPICEPVDALVRDRARRPGRRREEALLTLRAGSGRQWDPHLVEAFIGEVAGKPGQLRAG